MNLINFTILVSSGITQVISEFDFDESKEIYWQNCTAFDELYWDIIPAPNAFTYEWEKGSFENPLWGDDYGFECHKKILPKVTFQTDIDRTLCQVDMTKHSTKFRNRNCIGIVKNELQQASDKKHDTLVIWIAHGFDDGPNQQPYKWSENLSESYIQRYQNKTVMVGLVDWSVGSRNHIANYGKSAVNTLVIGRYLALLSSKISLPTNREPKEILVTPSMPSTSIDSSSTTTTKTTTKTTSTSLPTNRVPKEILVTSSMPSTSIDSISTPKPTTKTTSTRITATAASKSKTICIGHSLGAHVCGFMGKTLQNMPLQQKKTLDKIIGMDPAGVLFAENKNNSKLQPGDAKIVEILHSATTPISLFAPLESVIGSKFNLGILDAVGTQDIYINGGGTHPYCNTTILSESCSHMSPIDLLIFIIKEKVQCSANWQCFGKNGAKFDPESLQKIRFGSQTQELTDAGCKDISSTKLLQIGQLDENVETNQEKGNYWLNAHLDSEHCTIPFEAFNNSINLSYRVPGLSKIFG